MRHQLVGPAKLAALRRAIQHLIGDRCDIEVLCVHQHVFELQAESFEGAERRARRPQESREAHAATASARSWMRRRNTPITSRYSACLRIWSSQPASTLGLSLISMT